jgi:hypothetical protein
MSLVNVIRKARRIFRDENNPIEAIKSIRMTTGVGLKAAKDFWNWMGYFNDMSATKLAEWWCQDHWCPIGDCGCAMKNELAEANTAGASKFVGTKPAFEDALSEPIPPQHRATATAEPRTVECKCGRADCANKFHAYLMAMIKKHGDSEAVQIILEEMDKMTTEQRANFYREGGTVE